MTGTVLLVASPGGHVDEMFEVASTFSGTRERLWVTAKTMQTSALLAHERVEWVPAVGTRQIGRAAASMVTAMRLLREHRPALLVSTGAALTVPYVVAARAHRVPVTYLESATRLAGPSMTGRIVQRLPGVTLLHQAPEWPRTKFGWMRFGSVFDDYAPQRRIDGRVNSVLLTVGSERFAFPRALNLMMDALDDIHVTWQTGNTPVVGDLSGEVQSWWPADELAQMSSQVDVVVTHAGVGSILMALRAGKCPVVIPRLADLGEHVDDHQLQLANMLEERGIVVVARLGDELATCIALAACRRIIRRDRDTGAL